MFNLVKSSLKLWHLLSGMSNLASKFSQIGPKWNKSGTFSDKIQNEPKSDHSEKAHDFYHFVRIWPDWSSNMRSLENDASRTSNVATVSWHRATRFYIHFDTLCLVCIGVNLQTSLPPTDQYVYRACWQGYHIWA